MNNVGKLFFCGILACFLALPLPGVVWCSGDHVNQSLYADLLAKYVRNGVVNYKGFQQEEKKLDQYLTVLEKTDTAKLSRKDQFAFYINAYNAWTIKLILSGYPDIESIKDLGSFFRSPWKKKICRIDGDVVSLDHIEHKILRPLFKDPRVHFAVNCASKGCPPLKSVPYEGRILDEQLDASTRLFLNDAEKNRLEGNTLFVSSILKWFSEDFNDDVVAFFLKFAQGDLKEGLLKRRDRIKVKYLDYDWSLNGH